MKRFPAAFAAFLLAAPVARGEEYRFLALEYPPYAYQDLAGGPVKGVAADLVREAFRRMGHTVQVEILPWPRVLASVKGGSADGFFTTFRVPEREAWADFSREELVPQVTSLFVRKGSGFAFSGDLSRLSGRTFGVVAQVSYGARFDRAVASGVLKEVLESADGEANFRQLLAGRVQVAASNRLGARFILRRLGRAEDVEELQPPLESVPSYLAFTRQRNLAALRDRFDRILRRMKADGTWARILKGA